jgi:hypothetical protein
MSRTVDVVAMTRKIKDTAGDVVVALAQLQLDHENLIAQLERDMKKSKPGTKTRLDYLRALGKERREHTEILQSLGFYPKSLGLQTVERYTFSSRVGIGGNGDSKAVRTIDAEFTDDTKRLTE